MSRTMQRWTAFAAALAAVAALAACSRSAPPDTPVAAIPAADEIVPPLAGAPSKPEDATLAEAAVAAGDTASAEPGLVARPVAYTRGSDRYGEGYGHGEGYDHRVESYAERARRLAYAQYKEQQRHAARERYLARERRLAEHRLARERQLAAHARDTRRWSYRHHQLVYERGRPARHAPARKVHAAVPAVVPAPQSHAVAKSRPTVKPAPPAAAPAKLTQPRQRVLVKPAKPIVLEQPPAKAVDKPMVLPLITAQAAPAITPDQAAAAPAVDLGTQLGELTTAAAQDMKDARLDLPPALASGGEGKVVLTLPADLLATIQSKASAVGLGASGKKVFITAKLAGPGYAITPNQDQTARIDAGQTVFAWDVKPSGVPGGVLTADMTGSLQGAGEAKTFALGAVTAQISAPAQQAGVPATAVAPVQAKLPHIDLKLPDLLHFRLQALAIPGHPTVDVPGVGPVASEKVVAGGLVLLILILLTAIARRASARRERAERRRRFHSFDEGQFGDEPSSF